MTKIRSLTPEQEDALVAARERWLSIGRSTAPLDKDKAAFAVKTLYRLLGKKEPKVLFFSSPTECLIAHTLLSKTLVTEQLRDRLQIQLNDQFRYHLSNPLWVDLYNKVILQTESTLRSQLYNELEDRLERPLRVEVWGQVMGQLDVSLWSELNKKMVAQMWIQLEDQLSRQICDQIPTQVGKELRVKLEYELYRELNNRLDDQSTNRLRNQLWGKLHTQLSGQLDKAIYVELQDQLDDETMMHLRMQIKNMRGGNLWASGKAFHGFCADIGVEYAPEQKELLDACLQESEHCHIWFPYEDIALLSERPGAIHLDDRDRLHNENGAALEYPDGVGVYSWHGTSVPEKWIKDKDNLKPEAVLAKKNTELRRAGCELLGWDKILDALPHKVLDESEWGTLLQVDLPDSPDSRFVKVTCGTGRTFVLPTDQFQETALEAVARSYRVSPEQYQRLQART